MQPPDRSRFRSRMFGWWYLLIGAGFVLLGVNKIILGDRWAFVALRWLIAAGFFALAYFELSRRRRK